MQIKGQASSYWGKYLLKQSLFSRFQGKWGYGITMLSVCANSSLNFETADRFQRNLV
jgi:hypothetical protein